MWARLCVWARSSPKPNHNAILRRATRYKCALQINKI